MANTLSVDDKYFLSNIVQLVHGWIIGDTTKLKHFRKQIKAFHKDYQKCDREWLREFKKTEKLDGESDKDHQKRTGHISPPWESPTDLLELPDCHTPLHVLRALALVFDSKEPKQSIPPVKILRASYVLLTILHDKTLESDILVTPISDGIWPKDEPWVVSQWNQMQQEKSGSRSIDLNLKLDRVFEHVKADLDKLPAGKGQEASGADAGGTEPSDLITLTVAIKKFKVSKTTLRRATQDGRLEKYPQKPKSVNSPLKVSENAVSKQWPRI